MKKREKEYVEFRYYEIPQRVPLIALMGERWVTRYGSDPMHFHNYMEIGYCCYGEGVMHLGKEDVRYGEGTVTVISKNFPHHTTGRDDVFDSWEYLFIDTERFLKNVYADKPVYANTVLERLHSRMFLTSREEAPEIDALVRVILNEMRNKEEFYLESVQGCLLTLLLKIARMNPADSVPEAKVIDDGSLNSILAVLNYIEKHYQEEIKVGQLAQICHMSETHFRRVFTEYMNTSPAEYVNLVRIERACEFLAKSDERLEDIAVKVGFQASATFIRNFKKIVGTAPHQWRSAARGKEDNPSNYNVSVLKGW